MRHSPLVLLHGFTGGPRSYTRVLYQLGDFTRGPVIAPYLCGHGPEWSNPEFVAAGSAITSAVCSDSFEAEVSGLAATLAAAGVSPNRPAVLVGYSLGARLALGLLLAQPTWFRSSVLIGVNPGLRDVSERARRLAEDLERARQLLNEGLESFLQVWERLPLFASQMQVEASALAAQSTQRREHHAAGLAYSLVRTGLGRMPDYWPGLGQVKVPVHLVVGERDDKFRAVAEQMRRILPSSELTVVTNVGHNVLLEAPDALASLLARLLVES